MKREKDGVDLALELIRSEDVGPKGGDLTRYKAEHRKSSHNAPTVNGLPGLHDFRFSDTATGGIQKEKPWHAMAALMVAHGVPDQEIADSADVTVEHLRHLKANRWFQEKVAYHVNEIGAGLAPRMQNAAAEAFERVVSMAEDADDARVKLSANLAIIEHGCGKPVQRVLSISQTSRYSSPAEEYADLQNQLAALEKARTGGTASPLSATQDSASPENHENKTENPSV